MEEEKYLINNLFFRPATYSGEIDEDQYSHIQASINTLDAFSRICNVSVYVIDYNRKNFLYISPNHLFLQDLTVEEFKEMGFLFFKKYTPEEDYRFLQQINQEGFKFYYSLPSEDRLKYTISYNFNILLNKKKVLINHMVTPIWLNLSHGISLSMCIVSLASKDSKQEIEIKNLETSQRFLYNELSRKWIEQPSIKLTEREISILRLSLQGFNNPEIAKSMYLDVNTIKFHKKKIFAKLGATNIQEAIIYASSKKLI